MGKKGASQKTIDVPQVPVLRVIGDYEVPKFATLVQEGDKLYYDVPWESALGIPETDRGHRFKKIDIFDIHTILLGKGNIPGMVAVQRRVGVSRSVLTVPTDRGVIELGGLDRSGDFLEVALEALNAYPDRFVIFANIDYRGFTEPGWTDRELRRFDELWAKGVRGIKGLIGQCMVIRGLNELLGLPKHHSFLTDPKLQPLWRHASDLGAIVFQHVGDAPVNHKAYPPEKAYAEFWETVEAYPNTIFVAPHLAGSVFEPTGTLDQLATWLTSHPNLYTTVSGLTTVLRPTTAFTPEGARKFHEFIVAHSDRVLFGTDLGLGREPTVEAAYYLYRRWFEDPLGSSFEMVHSAPLRVYGLGLPNNTLEKVYHGNLERLLSRQRR
jgi:hypothetical protein